MRCWLALAVLSCSLYFPTLAAPPRGVDSLYVLLKTDARLDTTRVRRYQALSDLLADDLPQVIAFSQKALVLSRRLHYPKGEGSALISLGPAARRQDNFPLARRYARQALAVFARSRDLSGQARAYLQLSLIDELTGVNLVAAPQTALKGLTYAERAHDYETQLYLQYTLGDIYIKLGNYTEALLILRTTLARGQILANQSVVGATLNLLGRTHRLLKHWPQATHYFRRAARLHRQMGDISNATTDEINLAELYAQQENYAQALTHGQAARALALAHHDARNLPSAELALARAYLHVGRADSALALAQHGFALSQQVNDKTGLADASDILGQTYARRGDFAQAYHYQSLWVSYQDSLAGAETQRKTSALRYGYELDKKQDQITLLTQARQLQRQQLWGLLAGLTGTVLVVGLLGRNSYLKQRANRALGEKNAYIAHQRDNLDRTLVELRATQSQLVQSEKMVALAALTAGVAHEIQNPLNFVNNFSEVGLELATELEAETRKPTRDAALEADLLADIKQNLLIINQHGTRAGDIVKGMLEHAHADKGQRQPLDLNKTVEEYLRLAYQNIKLKNQGFTFTRTLDLDPRLGLLPLVPQEIGRVLLNLFASAVYAVRQKAARLGPAYVPEVRVSTARQGGQVVLRVRDNGTGIPAAVINKIFDPFFTTKPPGEGTGLGLWFSYDIITKSYGGTLTVATQGGEYTELTLKLPAAPTPPPAAEAPAVGRLVAASARQKPLLNGFLDLVQGRNVVVVVLGHHGAVVQHQQAGVGANDGLEHRGIGKIIGGSEVHVVPERVELAGRRARDGQHINVLARLGGLGKELIELLEALAVGLIGVLYDENQLVAGEHLLGHVVAVGVGDDEIGDERLRLLGVEHRHRLVFPGRVGRKLVGRQRLAVARERVLVARRLGRLHQRRNVVAHFVGQKIEVRQVPQRPHPNADGQRAGKRHGHEPRRAPHEGVPQVLQIKEHYPPQSQQKQVFAKRRPGRELDEIAEAAAVRHLVEGGRVEGKKREEHEQRQQRVQRLAQVPAQQQRHAQYHFERAQGHAQEAAGIFKRIKKPAQKWHGGGKYLEVFFELVGRAHRVVELDEARKNEQDAQHRPAQAGDLAHRLGQVNLHR